MPPTVVETNGDSFNFAHEQEKELESGSQIFLGSYAPLNESISPLTYSDLMIDLNGEGSEGLDPDYLTDVKTAETILAWQQQGTNGEGSGEPIGSVFGQEMGTINLSTLEVAKDRRSVNFIKTSIQNNLVIQMFETDTNTLLFKKLDVIDYGEIPTQDELRPTKRIFFVGKVFLNFARIPTFVNLFTIILD